MFAPDVVNLRQFYAAPLGESARMLIARCIARLWPSAPEGEVTIGIGYATPYLEPGASVFAGMPAQQGAAYWPSGQNNRVFLAHETDLPLSDHSVNRVLLLHSVEHSERLSWMMDEVWRVLTPGGRVLAVVPNRLSFWARSPRSPFGYGRPFSMTQLRDLMAEHQFSLLRSRSALFTPPLRARLPWRIAPAVEILGRILFPFLGGVLLVEAEKQIYGAIHQPVAARKRYVPIPVTKPALGLK